MMSLSVFILCLQGVLLVMSADVDLQCPVIWGEGDTLVLTCRVDATKLSAENCPGQLTDGADFKFFKRRPTVGVPASSECLVSNFRTKCLLSNTNSGCTCYKLFDGTYELTFHVEAEKKRYEGGYWDCEVICTDESHQSKLNTSASLGCSKVTFGPKTIYGDEIDLAPSKETNQEDKPNAAAIGLGVTLVVVVVAVTAAAIFLSRTRLRRSDQPKDSDSLQANYPDVCDQTNRNHSDPPPDY